MQVAIFGLSSIKTEKVPLQLQTYFHCCCDKYHLLTEFEVRTVSYEPSFFPFDLWPKRWFRKFTSTLSANQKRDLKNSRPQNVRKYIFL